jgi:hypothetical protein
MVVFGADWDGERPSMMAITNVDRGAGSRAARRDGARI